MPAPGVPNNPEGVNSWTGFGDEEPYGQATRNAALARSAPMAGAAVASGPIAAPQRSGRQAHQQRAPEQAVSAAAPAPTAPVELPYDVRLAQWWKSIAAIPGASDLVKQYAVLAEQKAGAGGTA